MSWLFLIVGIVCLIALQWLRSVMSIIFSVPRVQLGRRPDPARFGGFDLLDETAAELAELGFGEPFWLLNEDDDDGHGNSIVDTYAVFPQAEKNVLAWIAPGVYVANPRQLIVQFTTELDDGRQAVTQVGEPFYAALGDERTPAQNTEPYNRPGEYRRHLEFVEELGVAPRQRPATARDALQFAEQHVGGIRRRLLDAGLLKESNGLARPGLRLGLRILLKALKQPKAKDPSAEPVPAIRLRHLQRCSRVVSNRAPSRSVQWLILGLSALLFLGSGWPVFGLQMTVILLAVVLFHEAGHWAAMRAFGYRNPHITLLPLLGGVAIGHESDPNAAKRAWVSLAGPLPGIVLGWGMLLVGGDLSMSETAHDWWNQTALILLIVNYLNILPIPPLDGSHVLTALLPPRWVVVQILVLFAGVAIAYYLSWTIDFWLLAIIASVQLLFVRSMWRESRLVRRIATEPADVDDRRMWVLEQLEELEGPATNAAKRLGQAEQVIRHLDLTPMGGFQRLFVSSVFAALLVVPVGFLSLEALTLSDSADEVFDGESLMGDLYADMHEDRKRLELQTDGLDLEGLLRLTSESELLPPAGEDSIAAAEARLGAPLPDELRNLYSIAEGIPDIGVGPVASIRPISETQLFDEVMMQWQYNGDLYLENDIVPVNKTQAWWVLSPDDEAELLMFYDPRARDTSARFFLLDADMAYTSEDLRSLIQRRWVNDQAAESYQRALEHELERAEAELADLTIVELAGELYQPGWLSRLIAGDVWGSYSATEGELEALERELGRPLPADHRALLTSDLSLALFGALEPTQVTQLGKVEDEQNEYVIAAMTDAMGDLDPGLADQCWVVFGFVIEGSNGGKSQTVIPRMLWCPLLPAEQQYFDAEQMRSYATLTDAVRAYVARLTMSY